MLRKYCTAECWADLEVQMVRIPITLSVAGETICFGTWFVEIGDHVREGERLAEVLIPGVVIDVLSPANGTLTEKTAMPRHRLKRGDVLGALTTDT